MIAARQPVRRGPAWSADLSAGFLYATGFHETEGAPGPLIGVAVRPPRPFTAQVAAAYLPRQVIALSTGSVRIDRVPIALTAAWSLRWPEIEVDLGLRTEVEILFVESRGIPGAARVTRLSVRLGPSGTLGFALGSRFRLAVSTAVLGVASGWDFVVGDTGDGAPRTRVASQVAALEASASLAWRFGP